MELERLLAPPLPPDCPWSGFTPPNADWCEEELYAWVVNPPRRCRCRRR